MDKSPKIKKIVIWASAVILFFIGGFLLWAHLASLDSASIAPGKVVVAGNRRVIEHLEGGIVARILVKNGDFVKPSTLLIQLEDVRARAAAEINRKAVFRLLAIKERILAELDQKPLKFSKNLMDASTPESKEIIQIQTAIFKTSQTQFKNAIKIYKQRIEQLETQISGKKAQLKANKKQLEFINKELIDVKHLAQKKLIKKSRLYSLQREAARLKGKDGELSAAIAELQQKIGETKLEIMSITDKRNKALLSELKETENKLSESRQKLKASEDTLARTQIRSPIAGTVVNSQIHTIGEVIKAGEPIMEIVPKNEQLVIEARLNPKDIDNVKVGMDARVSFIGLSQRNTPIIMGKLIYISADELFDAQSNQHYFKIRVNISPAELKKIKDEVLYPGMPVEVMVISKKATPWTYFVSPIYKSFNRAFRED